MTNDNEIQTRTKEGGQLRLKVGSLVTYDKTDQGIEFSDQGYRIGIVVENGGCSGIVELLTRPGFCERTRGYVTDQFLVDKIGNAMNFGTTQTYLPGDRKHSLIALLAEVLKPETDYHEGKIFMRDLKTIENAGALLQRIMGENEEEEVDLIAGESFREVEIAYARALNIANRHKKERDLDYLTTAYVVFNLRHQDATCDLAFDLYYNKETEKAKEKPVEVKEN